MNAIPISRNAVANAPRKKYFNPASFDSRLRRFSPAITYSGTDIISSPRNITTRSVVFAITIMPMTETSNSE